MTKQFTPNAPELWSILNAGHIGFPKILEEFLDNAFSSRAEHILIRLTQQSAEKFQLEVGDSGCGIREEDLKRVFGVGYPPAARKAGPHNQFGIGLKSALASCDPGDLSWTLYSSADGEHCVHVLAPYCDESMDYTVEPRDKMPAPAEWTHGTWISTPVSRSLFRTCAARAVNDRERLDALMEELQVTYAPLLAEHDVVLEWEPLGGRKERFVLKPLTPCWTDNSIVDREEVVDFGAGELTVRYSYGGIEAAKQAVRYFKGNITSSGLMIYLNGRLIQHNLFETVWKQPHPNYNRFLFMVDLRHVDEKHRDALPIPRPDKDQMVMGDARFEALTEWVCRLCPNPKEFVRRPKENKEQALCRALAEKLESGGIAEYTSLELPVETGESKSAGRSDLYVRMKDERAVLYEAKLGTSKVQDVAQLATYCLLLAERGPRLDELVLVARRHSAVVREFCEQLCRRWYRDLPVPAIRLLTWDEVDKGMY